MHPAPDSIQIRQANADDAPRLSVLFAELSYLVSPQEIRDRFDAMQDSVLVAVRGEQVVGVATLNIMPVLHRPTAVGRISALVVSANERGTGVGRQLVSAAEHTLRARGCKLIELTSGFRLEPAHAFYKHIGYEATSFRFKKDL